MFKDIWYMWHTAISESTKLGNQYPDVLVKENRKYLKQLINAVLYLCKKDMMMEKTALTKVIIIKYWLLYWKS